MKKYRKHLCRLLLAAVMGGLLLWGHRGNMVRLVKGTESKFAFHKGNRSKAGGAPGAEKEDKPAPEQSKASGAEGEKTGEGQKSD